MNGSLLVYISLNYTTTNNSGDIKIQDIRVKQPNFQTGVKRFVLPQGNINEISSTTWCGVKMCETIIFNSPKFEA